MTTTNVGIYSPPTEPLTRKNSGKICIAEIEIRAIATLYDIEQTSKNLTIMLITISLLILAYMIMGKDTSKLLEKVRNIDLRGKINALMERLRPWALKAGRIASRPLLQFYYVMDDEKTSTVDRVLIYAAIAYTILPMDLIPKAIYKFLGILDDGVALLYVYRKIKERITPEINTKVEATLDEWFGVEYEMVGE